MKTRCPHCDKEIELEDEIIIKLASALMGRKGGQARTPAKSRAATARNAKRKAEGKPEGGRPKKGEKK